MRNIAKVAAAGSLLITLAAAGGVLAQGAFKPSPKTSFFVTSVGSGKGGDLGGLAGADAHCSALATAAGIKGKTWRAYLSSSSGNARDRIGKGPWYNVKGVEVASSVDDLHSVNNELSKANSLTEKGGVVNGVGDTPNQHDILTGSDAEGKLQAPIARIPPNQPAGTPPPPAPANMTCNDWTSSEGGGVMLGHNDRKGGGAAATSWNASHAGAGCSQANLVQTGGNGLFYCFATN